MLEGAPTPEAALTTFIGFVGNLPIVAHNAEFDTGFLRSKLRQYFQKNLTNPVICTLRLSRYLLTNIPNHKLATVAKALEVVPEDQHRAMSDCQTTIQIFRGMLDLLAGRGIQSINKVVTLSDELGTRESSPF